MTRRCACTANSIFNELVTLWLRNPPNELPAALQNAGHTVSASNTEALMGLHDDLIKCANCRMFSADHANGRCLYSPTRYKPVCEVPHQPGDTDAEPE